MMNDENTSNNSSIFTHKEQAFFRFLAGQALHIEPLWAVNRLNEVLLLNAFNEAGNEDMCQIEKDKTQSIDIYYDGGFVGNYSTLDDVKKGSVAVVNMSGVMMLNDAMCAYGMKSMSKRLRMLYADSRISGIVMDIDTGGGQSHSGDVLFNAIADKNKPVLVHTTMLASAGIKGTLKSDEIIAAGDATLIGSIGTMMTMPKWVIAEAKENDIELYSETSGGKNGAWRALKNGNFQPYIDQLTKNDELFMKQVRKHRPLKGTPTERKVTLDGSVFPAIEAKSRGLVDSIGSLSYALKRVNAHTQYYK